MPSRGGVYKWGFFEQDQVDNIWWNSMKSISGDFIKFLYKLSRSSLAWRSCASPARLESSAGAAQWLWGSSPAPASPLPREGMQSRGIGSPGTCQAEAGAGMLGRVLARGLVVVLATCRIYEKAAADPLHSWPWGHVWGIQTLPLFSGQILPYWGWRRRSPWFSLPRVSKGGETWSPSAQNKIFLLGWKYSSFLMEMWTL